MQQNANKALSGTNYYLIRAVAVASFTAVAKAVSMA
jgi:hypothetical protein